MSTEADRVPLLNDLPDRAVSWTEVLSRGERNLSLFVRSESEFKRVH